MLGRSASTGVKGGAVPPPEASTAFLLKEVLPKSSFKIESIAVWGDRILVGTTAGTLFVYTRKEPRGAGGDVECKDPAHLTCMCPMLSTCHNLHIPLHRTMPCLLPCGAGG